MWQTATWAPDHSSAVSVVPIPSMDGSVRVISCRVAPAPATALARAGSIPSGSIPVSSGASALIATALATSPAAWPPIPSAMTSRCGPA